jgi:hypothetical protein
MLTKTLLMVEPAFQISQALLGPLPLVIPLKIVVVCTDSAPHRRFGPTWSPAPQLSLDAGLAGYPACAAAVRA